MLKTIGIALTTVFVLAITVGILSGTKIEIEFSD
jgi:hypothetical protein